MDITTDLGAATRQPGAQPTAAADRARQQQCEALSHRERLDPPVEAGRPGSGDGTLLCPAQLPGTPDPVATNGLIGINSNAPFSSCPLWYVSTQSLTPWDAPLGGLRRNYHENTTLLSPKHHAFQAVAAYISSAIENQW